MADRPQEEQLRLVTDAAPLLLGYVDADLRYRFANRTYEDWFGQSRTEVEGKTLEEVLGPAAFAVLRPHVEAVLSGREVTFEQEVPYKEGGVRHIHASYVPDKDAQGRVRGFVVVVVDVTGRKQQEQERERLLGELRYLTAHARCLLWHGTLTVWENGAFHWDTEVLDPAAAQAFLPLALRPGERYPDAWYRHRLPEGKARTDAAWKAAIQTGQPSYSAEFGCPAPDGQIRWFEERVYLSPFVPSAPATPSGESQTEPQRQRLAARVVGVALDITERRQAEQANARLAAIVDSSRDAVLSKTLHGIITTWNRGAERMYGYAAGEVVGQHVSLLIPPDHAEDLPRILARIGRGEWVEPFETRRRRKDGVVLDVSVTVSPIRDTQGQVVGASAIARDITERKQAEEELRLVTAGARCLLWHAAIEETGGDLLLWDITVPDEAAAQRFLPLQVPPGRSYTDALYAHRLPEDRARTDAHAVQCIRAGEGYSQEFRCRDNEGRVRWLKEDARVAVLTPGRWRAVGVITDVTDLKEAEAEKARLLAQVEANARQQRAFLRDVLASVTEGRLRLAERAEDLPPRLGPVAEPVALTAKTLRTLRVQALEAARFVGFGDAAVHDLLTAAGEAAMNAVAHGRNGVASVGADPRADVVQVWVHDRGGGIELSRLPQVTLERGFSVGPTPGFGHGFWMMLQTAHRLWLLTGPEGTTVVLEMNRTPPEPAWLSTTPHQGLVGTPSFS